MILALFLLPNPAMAENESLMAEDITITPMNLTIHNISIGENRTVNITIISNESMYDDVAFTSEYLLEYSPIGKHMDPDVSEIFLLIFKAPDEYNRSTTELNTTHIVFEDEVIITGHNGSVIKELGKIAVFMNVTLTELGLPEREYIFKKCFIENGEEFCSISNFSEMIKPYQNITVINETTENNTYNIMMPYEVTKQFMEEYSETLQYAADQMSTEREWIVRILNETINMQKTKNNQFQNAFMLENYLKNPEVPLWIELAPNNYLKNLTGFSDQELMDAMNVLFQGNKLAQKTEKEIVTIPMQKGIMTQEVQTVYLASSERVSEEEKQESAKNTVYLAVGIVMMVIIIGLFYAFVWKNRVSWKK